MALGKSLVVPKWARHYPIAEWTRSLYFEEKSAPFDYPDTLWTYEAGILVFPSAELESYVLFDLENDSMDTITFRPQGKIVRRIALKQKVLVIEWAELEGIEIASRHFATAYDVVRDSILDSWVTVFRSVVSTSKGSSAKEPGTNGVYTT